VCKTRARITDGDRVVVIGAGGGVGIHMVEMAALFGGKVAGLETRKDKFPAIRRAGGTPVQSRTFDDVVLPWGADRPTVVIDLLGNDASLTWGMSSLATGGRLVVLTTFRSGGLATTPRDLVFRELSVMGSRYASKAELAESAELVAAGRIHPVVSHVVAPDGIEEVHRKLRQGSLVGRGAVVWP
jgi:propanol-preferring alcohol dehydrogenase